jgi:hypothetical protein
MRLPFMKSSTLRLAEQSAAYSSLFDEDKTAHYGSMSEKREGLEVEERLSKLRSLMKDEGLGY